MYRKLAFAVNYSLCFVIDITSSVTAPIWVTLTTPQWVRMRGRSLRRYTEDEEQKFRQYHILVSRHM